MRLLFFQVAAIPRFARGRRAPRRRRGVRLLFFQVAAIPRFARGRLVAPRRRRGVRLLFFQVAAIPRFARGRLAIGGWWRVAGWVGPGDGCAQQRQREQHQVGDREQPSHHQGHADRARVRNGSCTCTTRSASSSPGLVTMSQLFQRGTARERRRTRRGRRRRRRTPSRPSGPRGVRPAGESARATGTPCRDR